MGKAHRVRFWMMAAIVLAAGPAPVLLGQESQLAVPARESVVFALGETPGRGYRIPAIVRARSGRLLAFCEQRVGLHDHAQNDIVLKISNDQGKTWGTMKVVADDGGDSLNDPRAVVLDSGRILLIYTRFPQGYHSAVTSHTKLAELGYDGPHNVRSYLTCSDDEGITWSQRREITRSIRRRDAIASGSPGIGIQLQHGEHRGRIVFACYETIPTGGRSRTWKTCAVFSDDGGRTWTMGKRIDEGPLDGCANEAQVVELAGGAILISARNQGGSRRKLAVSHDGGLSWSPYRLADELVTPACMGSVIRYRWPSDGHPGLLLHSLPYGKGRQNGVIFASRDEGQSWQLVARVQPAGFAYSCLVRLDNGDVGCLYETGGYKQIRFALLPASCFGNGD